MKENLAHLVVLGLLSTSIHWLIGRSEIGRPCWSRARGWVAKLLRCAGCSGFWIGLVLGWIGIRPIGDGLPGVLASGLLSIVMTPIFESVLLWGLANSAIDEEPPPPDTSSSEEAVTPLDRPR